MFKIKIIWNLISTKFGFGRTRHWELVYKTLFAKRLMWKTRITLPNVNLKYYPDVMASVLFRLHRAGTMVCTWPPPSVERFNIKTYFNFRKCRLLVMEVFTIFFRILFIQISGFSIIGRKTFFDLYKHCRITALIGVF